MSEKKGYSTITYRMRFYDKHLDWLRKTGVLYNQVVKHYCGVLAEHLELLSLTNFHLMRELEVLTVGSREKRKAGETADYPLIDMPAIPLYFRRAAINGAIYLMRSFQTQKGQMLQSEEMRLEFFRVDSSAENVFSLAAVYYKGMYKELTENTILLKVFNGEKWIWNRYRFSGRTFPKDALILSPSVYVEKQDVYLHVPVRMEVADIRSVQERMMTEKRILALGFPGNDCIAVGALIRRDGSFERAFFFRGRLEMKAKKRVLKRKILKIKQGRKEEEREENRLKRQKEMEQYYKKIENINDYYAHLISRRILDCCIEQGIRVIAVPHYQQAIDFSQMQYLKMDSYEWIGRRIIRYLKYKAFSAGILVSGVSAVHISDCCSECGAKIRRYNEGHIAGIRYFGGSLFFCPNGHRGNSGLNTAKNVGRRFLSYYK